MLHPYIILQDHQGKKGCKVVYYYYFFSRAARFYKRENRHKTTRKVTNWKSLFERKSYNCQRDENLNYVLGNYGHNVSRKTIALLHEIIKIVRSFQFRIGMLLIQTPLAPIRQLFP